MEDDNRSNRHDGSNEEQSKEPVFHSKDIKKNNTEYFVRVEGAEERKKEVIRRMKQQKESLIKAQKEKEAAEKRIATEEKKEAKKAAKKEKREAFWAKNKKLVIAIVVVLLILVGTLAAYFIKNPLLTEEQVAVRQSMERNTKALINFRAELDKMAEDPEKTTQDIVNWAEKQIDEAPDNHEKFDRYSALTSYLLNTENHYEDAKQYLEKMESLAADDTEKLATYSFYSLYYFKVGDIDKAKEYSQKKQELNEKVEKALEDNTYGE